MFVISRCYDKKYTIIAQCYIVLNKHLQKAYKLCNIWGLHVGDYEEWSPRMLHHVALVRTDISEEHSASIIRVTRISKLGMLAVSSNQHMLPSSPILVTLMMEPLCFSETSDLTRATQRNIPEDSIHRICWRIQKVMTDHSIWHYNLLRIRYNSRALSWRIFCGMLSRSKSE
jgi:hypothetical protein